MKLRLLTIIFFPIALFAQDQLLELGANLKLIKERNTLSNQATERNLSSVNAKKKTALSLPFFDDFSQHYFYPKQDKWQDNHVFINNNFADYPISYGVATFDGLDYTGYPYDFNNPTAYGIADYLTSQPIDLSNTTDSVYLSFFYQPQGFGNKPETNDSLTLEFYSPTDSIWVSTWGVPGESNKSFTQVMIPVANDFLTDSFVFRFKNYATLSGNVDHWNLDYIYLDDSRTFDDTTLNDVTLTRQHYNFLNEYTSMPWSHYMVDSVGNMATAINVDYRNNHDNTYAVFYKYQVIEDNGQGNIIETYPSSISSKNVLAHSSLVEPQAVNNMPANDFYFPGDETALSKVFQIKNYFDLNTLFDDHQENDTVLTYQVFGNDYAYDDGSAEVGYGVQGTGGKLAHEFSIKKSDTLTALKIYFSPIMDNHGDKTFKLTIWSSLSPENIIYQQINFYNPVYSETNEFLYYALDNPLYLSAGTYYIGYEKITEDFLNVGYDLNTDNSQKVHYNSVGVWQQSTYNGSLMMRPVFDAYPQPIVGVEEVTNLHDINIYPNPAKHNFTVELNQFSDIKIIDLSGKTHLTRENLIGRQTIDLSEFKSGLYFLIFQSNDQQFSKKLIISK